MLPDDFASLSVAPSMPADQRAEVKVTDYIVERLAAEGVRHVFAVQGGAVAHIYDSIAKRDDIDYVCAGHEQGGALAVHGYVARTGGFGCAMATTGPGIINMINGVATLFYDSLPAIFLGGQVTRPRYRAKELGVRQLGFQESPHADMMRPVTKYSTTITDKNRIRYELEKAIHIAKSGRPGPVFLDICDDVQREMVDPGALEGFQPSPADTLPALDLDAAAARFVEMLRTSERPVFVVGGGVRTGGHGPQVAALAERLGVPCLLTWGALDIVPGDHPLNAGCFGLHGGRAGNFTAQNCDLMVGLGARFTQHQTGTPPSSFARGARRVAVDIDPAELGKLAALDLSIELPVNADVGAFLQAVERHAAALDEVSPRYAAWRERVVSWRGRYRPGQDLPSSDAVTGVDPYSAIAALSEAAGEGDAVLGDVGATLSWMFQAWQVKRGQTLLTSFNNHIMGYALPAAIGAALAQPGRTAWSLNGDGGFVMNIQELGLLAKHRLPVKVIVLNNHGYGVIQQTQEDYFDSRYNGVTPATGLMDPDFVAIAEGFGVTGFRIERECKLADGLAAVAAHDGPCLCEIEIDPVARIRPAVVGGRPIEDTAPLLPREEFLANMIVEPMS